MPNPFDQFDQQTQPVQQAGNPFDQFDQSQPPQAMAQPVSRGTMPQNDMAARVQAKLSQKIAQNQTLADRLGRGFGLAGRYAIEGVGDIAQIVSEPVRRALNVIPGVDIGYAPPESLPNIAGLPQPQTEAEKVVGKASRTLVSAAPFVKAGQLASEASGPVTQAVGKMMATQPAVQASAAGGAGAAGEYAKQEGASPTGQFVASMAGGLSPALASSLGNKAVQYANMLAKGKVANELADALLVQNGIDVSGMQYSARNALRNDIKAAMKKGDTMDSAALRRLADYRQVGATPTAGRLTLKPAAITMEENLKRIGSNTGDEALQRLGQIQNDNEKVLIERINALGAENAADPVKAGSIIMKTLVDGDKVLKSGVNKAYNAVRDSGGRYAKLNTRAFSETANNLLDEKMLRSALPTSSKNLLNDISAGKIPFDVNTMVQLDKRLSGQARDAIKSGNSEAALAIKQIRDALQATPIESTAGEQAVNQYNQARQLAAQRFSLIDRTPALKAALDDAAPDKFVRQFIISGGAKANERDVASLADLISDNPQAMEQARGQILSYIKKKAIGLAPDEEGKVSPAGMRKALDDIGKTKLGMFFNKQEIGELEAISRVAGYEKVRPTGSAVNESNTAATLIGRGLDALASGAEKLTLGQSRHFTEPFMEMKRGKQAKDAINIVNSLIQRAEQPSQANKMIMPSMYGGLGAMSAEQQNNQ